MIKVCLFDNFTHFIICMINQYQIKKHMFTSNPDRQRTFDTFWLKMSLKNLGGAFVLSSLTILIQSMFRNIAIPVNAMWLANNITEIWNDITMWNPKTKLNMVIRI